MSVLADTVHWNNIGANPSQIKTDYVIAYLSLAAGRNLGATFDSANVASADAVEIAAIMSVEERLRLATSQKLKVAAAWTDFRGGDYAAAKHILDSLGVAGVLHDGFVKDRGMSGKAFVNVTVYSLKGQVLYFAQGKKFDGAMLNRLCGGKMVVVRYTDRNLLFSRAGGRIRRVSLQTLKSSPAFPLPSSAP